MKSLLVILTCLCLSGPAEADTVFEPPAFEPTSQEIAEGGGETTQAEQESELEPESEDDKPTEIVPVWNVPPTGNVLPHRVQTNLPGQKVTHRHSKGCPKKSRVHARKCRKMAKRRSGKVRKGKR